MKKSKKEFPPWLKLESWIIGVFLVFLTASCLKMCYLDKVSQKEELLRQYWILLISFAVIWLLSWAFYKYRGY
ncbi:MAG: hypothetical protein U5L10_04955 [Candidatus Moranbacteria bacterium]|nr:hypothetical protein [Candidatus Moranbacteria bacterium]